jgi:predicted nuclease of predicted toxin-antitoxin system
MNILVDENIPNMTVLALRQAGHDVLDVRGTQYEGAADETIWQIATEQRRLLITTDKGFVQRREEAHAGILVVRLKRPTGVEIHRRVLLALAQVSEATWPGLVVVMRDMAQSMWRAGERL